jgi:hypothetical protein
MSTVLNGPAGFLGMNFNLGVEAFMRQANEAGGVYGR